LGSVPCCLLIPASLSVSWV